MKPGLYFFLLGLFVGGAGVGTFAWYAKENAVEAATDELRERMDRQCQTALYERCAYAPGAKP